MGDCIGAKESNVRASVKFHEVGRGTGLWLTMRAIRISPRNFFAEVVATQPTRTSHASESFDELFANNDDNSHAFSYADWIKKARKEIRSSKGPLFLGKNRVFPCNPHFKPQRGLSEQIKSKIFELSQTDPSHYSPKNLARRFCVSVERIDAILKLKTLEGTVKIPNASSYVRRMESILGVEGSMESLEQSDVAADNQKREKKRLVAIPFDSKIVFKAKVQGPQISKNLSTAYLQNGKFRFVDLSRK